MGNEELLSNDLIKRPGTFSLRGEGDSEVGGWYCITQQQLQQIRDDGMAVAALIAIVPTRLNLEDCVIQFQFLLDLQAQNKVKF